MSRILKAKDLIDWKLVNSIIDKCTHYEDSDGTLTINISAPFVGLIWSHAGGFRNSGTFDVIPPIKSVEYIITLSVQDTYDYTRENDLIDFIKDKVEKLGMIPKYVSMTNIRFTHYFKEPK